MGIIKRGDTYHIDFYFHGQRIREAVSPKKKLAEQALAKRKTEIAENKFLDKRQDPKTKNIKFKDIVHEYIEVYAKINKKAWSKNDHWGLKTAMPLLGHKNMRSITVKDIDEYKRMRTQQVSRRSVDICLQALRNLFKKAIEWGYVEENPAIKVRRYRADNQRLRYLEKDEARRLLEECNHGDLKSAVIFTLNTGFRRGEIAKLKWSEINFQQNVIYLPTQKNGKSGSVPLNSTAKKALMDVRRKTDCPYVFVRVDGKPYNQPSMFMRPAFEHAVKRAGIQDFHFHDLRHTFASWLVMAGVHLATV